MAAGGAALAEQPVAIVEDVNASRAGVEFMDYVEVGRMVRLAPDETIVIGYFKSCLRESIRGGTVVIGNEQSEVKFGHVDRVHVACDSGKADRPKESRSSAGMVFRDVPRKKTVPKITIYGLSPVIETRGAGELTIDRIDRPAEHHEIILRSSDLLRGVFYDLARSGTMLVAGGVYRASLATEEIVFTVDPLAKPGGTPLLGRILRLQSQR